MQNAIETHRLGEREVSSNTIVRLLNVKVDNFCREELLNKLADGGVVVTLNVDHLVMLQNDPGFYEAYQAATYRVCDSQILYFLSRLLRHPFKEKIAGSDLLPAFCDYYRDAEEVKLFLLGAAPGVAKEAMRRINRRCDRDIVVAAHSPSFGFERNENECLAIVDQINRSGATVLVVGVGAPKQEKWILKYRSHFKHVKTFMAVGAAINFEAGHVKRAPRWASNSGLEWLHRLTKEPARLWRRYLVEDTAFLLLFAKQLLGVYKNPWRKHDVES